MNEPEGLDKGAARPERRRPFDWNRFIGSDAPERALAEVARMLGRPTVGLSLFSGDRRIASWQAPGPHTGAQSLCNATIGGAPEWRLSAVTAGVLSAGALGRAVVALEAWREAQSELGRAEARLAIRTRELDLIQTLGRRAAEARTASELFSAVVGVLQQGEDLDLALVAHALNGENEITAFLGRPFTAPCLSALCGSAAELLGWPPESVPAPETRILDVFDEALGQREEVVEQDRVVLPILRRESVVACLVVAPSRRAREEHLRLMYSAANQLCLHLDRILTVREAEADRFRSILDSMPQAVILTDGDLRIAQCNRAATALLERIGATDASSLGAAIDRLSLLESVDRVRREGAAVAEQEATLEDETAISVTISPSIAGAAGSNGLVFVLTDVTESRRLQRQLAHSEKMSSLGQMISGVAHELNNPLASIVGYSQLLRSACKEDKLARRAKALDREATRCRKIVENLLSFARRREPERKRVSLNDVIRSVQSLMGYQLRVDNVELRQDLDPELPSIRADAHQLQQVLVNLLTNAKQAIRQVGDGGWILLRTAVDSRGRIALEVRDSGPGIPEAIRERVFDPFFTTKAEGQGTGLGLSLVYGIVNAHDGTIEIGSADGGGAELRVTLPPATSADEDRESSRQAEPTAPATAGRILVVDDEPSLASMICDALSQDGHSAEVAGNGNDALIRLEQERFDLVISDVRMPGMDGERLYEELQRSRPELCERLLLTTGDTLGTEPGRIAARTGLNVLHKPFDLDQLRRLVRERLTPDISS